MDHLGKITNLIRATLPLELVVDADTVGKIAALVRTSGVRRAQQMADEAAAALSAIGVNLADVSPYAAMAFAARMALEKHCALGFLRRSNFSAPHGKRLRLEVKNGADISNLEDRRKEAFFLDVALVLELNFSPVRAMLTRLSETGTLGDDPFQEYLTLRPFSAEANQTLQSFSSLNFTNIKIRPVINEPKTVDDLRQEVRLTEPEAARIKRIAAKTLADKRRAGLIPGKVYTQDAEEGTVYYITQKWLAYVAGETLEKSK